jgi:hypothetical protein
MQSGLMLSSEWIRNLRSENPSSLGQVGLHYTRIRQAVPISTSSWMRVKIACGQAIVKTMIGSSRSRTNTIPRTCFALIRTSNPPCDQSACEEHSGVLWRGVPERLERFRPIARFHATPSKQPHSLT